MPDSASPSTPHNATHWQAKLELGFTNRQNKTVLSHRQHSGPLLVQRPFHPEGGVCHTYIIHPPGGIVGGDQLHIGVSAGPNAHALLTTPAAGKFYRSDGRRSRQIVDIQSTAATLEWLPQETIFYPEASAQLSTRIKLDTGSKLFAWEVACCGLPARGERFSLGRVAQGFEVWLGEKPLLHDRLRLDGANGMMDARWGLAGLPAIGTMLAYPCCKDDVAASRAAMEALGGAQRIGISLVDGLLVCRALAAHADTIKRSFAAVWSALRPRMLGRAALAPRIWAT